MAKESLPQFGAAVYCLPPALQNEIACSANHKHRLANVRTGTLPERKPENVVQQIRINRVTPEENRSQTLIAAHHHCHQEGWL